MKTGATRYMAHLVLSYVFVIGWFWYLITLVRATEAAAKVDWVSTTIVIRLILSVKKVNLTMEAKVVSISLRTDKLFTYLQIESELDLHSCIGDLIVSLYATEAYFE